MTNKEYKKLGELLLEQEAIKTSDLEQALNVQREVGGLLGTILVRLGMIAEDIVVATVAQQKGFGVFESAQIDEILKFELKKDIELPAKEWRKSQSVFCWTVSDVVNIACKNPLDAKIRQVIMLFYRGKKVKFFIGTTRLLEQAWITYEKQLNTLPGIDFKGDLNQLAEEAPVIDKVNEILAFAVERKSSDIHIEPQEDECVVRFRTDGVLVEYSRFPSALYDAVSSRIKLISGMDIAEKRRPQDGRIATKILGEEFDIRVSSAPSVDGESLVMRLLQKENNVADINGLGLMENDKEVVKSWITQPYGMILVTGPTGSGKSTTLYSCLKEISDGKKKIITVEDPVEYKLPGITQIQANADIGYDFASALRTILRQDPDVIMIGEIRDLETAKIAIQSALTGHLVLSTLHTNDAASAFVRLVDMGVEPFLVSAPMIGVQAQRLVRRLCDHCAVEVEPTKPQREKISECKQRFGETGSHWKEAVGCPLCGNTGFKGRIGIYEFLSVDNEVKKMISNGRSSTDINEYAQSVGIKSLEQDGLSKVLEGKTSYAEILRVTENS